MSVARERSTNKYQSQRLIDAGMEHTADMEIRYRDYSNGDRMIWSAYKGSPDTLEYKVLCPAWSLQELVAQAWFFKPDAQIRLTAYGVEIFEDLVRIIEENCPFKCNKKYVGDK